MEMFEQIKFPFPFSSSHASPSEAIVLRGTTSLKVGAALHTQEYISNLAPNLLSSSTCLREENPVQVTLTNHAHLWIYICFAEKLNKQRHSHSFIYCHDESNLSPAQTEAEGMRGRAFAVTPRKSLVIVSSLKSRPPESLAEDADEVLWL
eukprot:TRINITY_DN13205_c0_g1_i1.p2 TRINITY_DN13205_c0_g1~~TRINITY_DN13205_c0_g1_i1.p2  ORF type:complete len:150 (+),score=3.81 TRINITY_DN13205_c0_g1_i1:271-720(+)